MKQLNPQELRALLDSGKPLALIDVREPEERSLFHIGGTLIPLPEIMEHIDEVPTDRPVVLYCKMGVRSQIAIQRLEDRYGWTHLYNLAGGIEAWKKAFPD
jgi:adenylyltransferase/sulfurtransferase